MTFPYIGQKVECIHDDWNDKDAGVTYPKKGDILTIKTIHTYYENWCCLTFYEIVNPLLPYREGLIEKEFHIIAFRPLDERKTSIECFKKMLTPEKVKC